MPPAGAHPPRGNTKLRLQGTPWKASGCQKHFPTWARAGKVRQEGWNVAATAQGAASQDPQRGKQFRHLPTLFMRLR